MLDYNRYASDQILHTQAIQLEAAHASVPLLFAHILPTLGLVSLLDIVHDASRLTAQAVTLEYFECPMTWEQSMSLGPSLALLADSVGKLDKLVEEELQPNMDSFAWRLPRLSWRPVQLLDQAILKTSNRSHGLESLICANELFPLLNNLATPRGINTLGLLPLEGYSVSLDECIGSVWPSIERTVSLLLMVHDHYNGVFEKGDELGLSRCRASLEQSLSRGKKRPWHVEENVGFIARLVQRLKTTPPVLFTTTSKQQASIPITIHTALFNYWSMLTLLHNLRHDNVLLYTSANAYLPPVIFRRKELNKTSIFDNPPFRQPSGSKRRQPLQVSEQDDHTLNTLAQSLRDRGISMDPPEEWTWTHPSINNKLLHSLLAARVPYSIPCPSGGVNSTVSSNPVSCTPFSSSSLSTSPSSSTQRKRLSLHSFRDLFVYQGNTITDLGYVYRDYSAFVLGEWRADRRRMRKYNDAAKRKVKIDSAHSGYHAGKLRPLFENSWLFQSCRLPPTATDPSCHVRRRGHDGNPQPAPRPHPRPRPATVEEVQEEEDDRDGGGAGHSDGGHVNDGPSNSVESVESVESEESEESEQEVEEDENHQLPDENDQRHPPVPNHLRSVLLPTLGDENGDLRIITAASPTPAPSTQAMPTSAPQYPTTQPTPALREDGEGEENRVADCKVEEQVGQNTRNRDAAIGDSSGRASNGRNGFSVHAMPYAGDSTDASRGGHGSQEQDRRWRLHQQLAVGEHKCRRECCHGLSHPTRDARLDQS
ncbi:MAG: hypothetical protein LQ338_007574 [Usnochroma carphineum]|nr:MAG: hypothetical protein LQ338_007574 [Usnochroma carphineum]